MTLSPGIARLLVWRLLHQRANHQPVTRPGDLVVLGGHRLLCGDSASEADVDRLLGGAPIHLVNTDPPYNVKVEPRSNNAIAAGNSSFAAPQARRRQKPDLNRITRDLSLSGVRCAELARQKQRRSPTRSASGRIRLSHSQRGRAACAPPRADGAL